MFGAMSAAAMVSPNMGTYAATGVGGNMIQQVLGVSESKAAKAAKLSQTETIMLYNMVRSTADHLVDNFRNYKKNITCLKLAESDLAALQKMVRDSHADQNPSSAVETEYTLRKAQRDIDEKAEDVRRFRQSLIDLAGADAVAKLDKQFDDETNQVDPALAAAEKEAASEVATTAGEQSKSDVEGGSETRKLAADPRKSPSGDSESGAESTH
jgi:hypothetical protein